MKRSRLNPINRERRAKRHAEAFGQQADLCRTLPCCACGAPPPSDPEHVRTRGAGGKDRDVVPLCRGCHNTRHAKGYGGLRLTLETRIPRTQRWWDDSDAEFSYATVREYFEHVAQGLEAVLSIRRALHDDPVQCNCVEAFNVPSLSCGTCRGSGWVGLEVLHGL